MSYAKPPQPIHVAGNAKGEEQAMKKGREPGRNAQASQYRDARDSTGIQADKRQPIHPDMPHIPPA